jgi:hypothetical protein
MSIRQPLKLFDPCLAGAALDSFWEMDIVPSGCLSDGIISNMTITGCCSDGLGFYSLRNFEIVQSKINWREYESGLLVFLLPGEGKSHPYDLLPFLLIHAALFEKVYSFSGTAFCSCGVTEPGITEILDALLANDANAGAQLHILAHLVFWGGAGSMVPAAFSGLASNRLDLFLLSLECRALV